MCKKLVFVVALLFGVPARAMDLRMQETPQDEQKVKILLQDEQNSESTYEVEIPVRLAKLIRPDFIADLLGDAPRVEDVRLPLPKVTIQTWRLIEGQLKRVYGIIHGVGTADQLKKEIFSVYDKLDSKSLSELICAADYLEMPLLLEIACDVVKKGALGKLSFEEIVSLPMDMGNRIILHKLLMLVGPVSGREQARAQHQGPVWSVCVTKDGKIVSGFVDGTVRVWDMQGRELAVCGGHELPVRSVCVTEDVKIVSGSDDRTVRVWDMEGNQLEVCGGHLGGVQSVCVTDGKFVSGSGDRTVRVWDMQGNELAVCRGHEGCVSSVCVTKDGKIVSGSFDRTVRVWEMDGNALAVCRGHKDKVRSVCVMKDGQIVSGSDDNTVRVWDMKGQEPVVCRGHQSSVLSVCVTKDGKIVSGSDDNTVRVWDMEGNELAVCKGHQSTVYSVCVTSDGKIVSGSDDMTVRVWDISLLDRIRYMDEVQAQAVWKLLQKIRQHGKIDSQKCWQEIESILMAESRGVLKSQDAKKCLACDKAGKLMRCSQCKKVYFCNGDCQRKVWAQHKFDCKKC